MQKYAPYLIVILVVIAVVGGMAYTNKGNQINEPSVQGQDNVPSPTASDKMEDTMVEEPEDLVIEDIEEGTGDEVVEGSTVNVHYTGTLTDGTTFDSSRDRGQTFEFVVGEGQVIEGWDQGLLGMKVGGIRRLTIPPALAYGKNGAGGIIPPNATLVFEIELVSVE